MLSRFFVLLPFVLSLAAFILTALSLFAGHKEGFMEDFAIARVNTSMLGQNILPTGNDEASSQNNSDKDKSLLDKAKDKWNEIKDDAKEKVNDIAGDVVDEVADELGIADWYSIHVMEACEGFYKPNATIVGAGLNVTNCTDSPPDDRFNLTRMIDRQLELGPFDISIGDLDWPDQIDDAISLINKALLALFILYVVGMGFSGLAMLASLAALFMAGRRAVAWANLVLALLAALAITVGSIVATVAARLGVDKINKHGERVGISARGGNKFLGISWAAAGCMLLAMAFWVVHLCAIRKERKTRFNPRKGSY